MNIENKIGPFMKSNDSVSKMMRRVLISLIPIILFAIYKNGILLYLKGYTNFFGMFYPLIFIVLGGMASLLTEEIILYIFYHERGKDLIDAVLKNYGFIPGLFLSLVLPINTPLALLFIGAVVASIVKMIMGGIGYNIFNPALIGALFVLTCYGSIISLNGGYTNIYELDTISSATPLTNKALVSDITYDTLVEPYGGLSNYFLGFIPGSLGEVSSLLIICAFIYLSLTKTIKWRITASYVSTFLLSILLYTKCDYGVWYILFELMSGGLLFGAVFMATDPVTSPVTKNGQYLYGITLGILTFLIRFLTSYPEGVMTSILLLNMFVFVFDKIGSRIEFNKLYRLFYVLVCAILIAIAFMGENKKVDDREFKILDVQKIDNNTIFKVSEKGFGGDIIASITFDSSRITNIEILDHSESIDRYNMVMENDYLDTIIKNQNAIDSVDTVSSATITSSSILKMVKNTMHEFLGEDIITIVSSEEKGDASIYVISVPSFSGNLKIQLVVKNGVIRSAIPLEYNDTCISKVESNYECPSYMDEGYIDNLIINQKNLGSVDTVSGATMSSKALKDAFDFVLNIGE